MQPALTWPTASPARLRAALLAVLALLASWTAAPAPPRAPPAADPWWKNAVIYEIYLRSFQDSNGDGVGDLNGVTQRLDYLASLGADAIWIAPFLSSGGVDFGNDVTDYENVDPQYGTLADFDRLLAEAQKRQLRVLIDLPLNQTSDQHPWFQDAARSRTSVAHPFYVWSDGRADGTGKRRPPNNWTSVYGGSAWEYVPAVGQFYYHRFYRQQPDLNWRNPHVERAMSDVMRFWLDRGAAGLRLGAVTALYEDPQLRNAAVLPGRNAQGDQNLSDALTNNLPETHALLRRLRALIEHYPGERVLLGDTRVTAIAPLRSWSGSARGGELQLPTDSAFGSGNHLDARAFRKHLTEAATQLPGALPLLLLDSADQQRSWDRYGDGKHDLEIAKVLATLLLTSRAAVVIYQGEELGQSTATPARVEDVRDAIGITGWPKEKGRDGERTPMQWDDSNAQAGFTASQHPWLPVPPGYAQVNVRTELADPDSLLNWHRKLIALRREDPALRSGRLVMLDTSNPNVLTYARVTPEGSGMIVSLNMSARTQTVTLNTSAAGFAGSRFRTLLSSPGEIPTDAHGRLALPPYAAWMAAIE